ncbi:MAG: helix-turn-helix domain-containing protein [Candidatus Nezhaarchaeales archaeon]
MTGERAAEPLQAGLTLTVNFGNPWKIVIPNELLAMLSEEAKRTVMDGAVNDIQRFKVLIEELHWHKGVSVRKLSKRLGVPFTTLWRWMRYEMNVKIRDNVTALQLVKTGRYKYPKRDFDGNDAERLKLWYFVHTDGSVIQNGQQVQVILRTPDPYLALLFKEVFGRYGHVGVGPYRDDKENYVWMLWVLLPLKIYWWLLKRRTPTPIDNNVKLYSVLSIAIDTEGSVYTCNRKGRKTAQFAVVIYNEKVYVVEALYEALKRYGYRVHLYATLKGTATYYGHLKDNCYHIKVRAKACVKHLLENVKLTPPHKRLKALLIRYALSEPSKPVYWSSIEPMYSEIEAFHEEMLEESRLIVKNLHESWRALTEKRKRKQITRTQYEGEREKLRAQAWKALETLKERYDERFKELERRFEAYFRARKPLRPSDLVPVNI